MTRILIVEDNENNLDMLSRRLQRKGFDVLAAMDGQQGIETALHEQPDLIIMDLSLPIIDGWEAIRQLKANATAQHIPIVALTAHAMASDRDKAIEAGADEYDTKPVEFQRLLGILDRLLGRA